MKLVLGTVQFGLDYGIAHDHSRLSDEALAALLEEAYSAGIHCLDTAQLYGDAEARLGRLMTRPFALVTKIPGWTAPGQAETLLRQSLSSLRRPQVEAVLLHRPEILLANPASYTELTRLKDVGLCGAIGVSVYEPAQLEAILSRYPIDWVQLPLNPLDQRFLPLLPILKDRGIRVHARSLYLQGLLLMPPAARPAWVRQHPALAAWDAQPGAPLQKALDFAAGQPQVDGWVLGVQNLAQLQGVLEAASQARPQSLAALACNDGQLLNPSLWPKEKDANDGQ
ncbi:aldo/keto reductase [Gallaecimonas kandeliae]|uniref:aldo/keto reductase n=1 Tax=Gallaecimonas kandeliae TaxID=3029055 RepID=UPI002649A765|nr:aldo/keto reductase [Gallaecimonas kandeliae]WKE66734.1 aldo/keto reductase [Gallaecimonas kandeliae]